VLAAPYSAAPFRRRAPLFLRRRPLNQAYYRTPFQVAERHDGSRIVLLRSSDGNEALRKVGESKALIDAELGTSLGLPADLSAFLYLEAGTGRVCGCAIAEPLDQAYSAVPPAPDAPDDGSVLRHDCVPREAMCGISHIWTEPQQRRRGIARELLDAVRQHFAIGFEIPRCQLAFSQPTPNGRRLATSYTESAAFAVYE